MTDCMNSVSVCGGRSAVVCEVFEAIYNSMCWEEEEEYVPVCVSVGV